MSLSELAQLIYLISLILQKQLYFMQRVSQFNLKTYRCIKSARNKVLIGCTAQHPEQQIVKIMMFPLSQCTVKLQFQFMRRLDQLRKIKNKGHFDLISDNILSILIKQTKEHRVYYLKKSFKAGKNLAKILKEEDYTEKKILKPKFIRQIIWKLISIMLLGGGFSNYILTLQNLIFTIQVHENYTSDYHLQTNVLSFAGFRLLKQRKDIEFEQFQEIGVFLDEQALLTGNIDRFQFKSRNLAILLICLITGRNICQFIFDGQKKQLIVTSQIAQQFVNKVIKQKLNNILQFRLFKQGLEKINISGLQDFIRTALSSPKDNLNWNEIHKMLIPHHPHNSSNINYGFHISKALWTNESLCMQSLLNQNGISYDQKNYKLYLLIKISLHLDILLQNENIKDMFQKYQFSYLTEEIYQRIVWIVVNKSKVQIKEVRELIELSQQHYKKFYYKQNDKIVYIMPQERKILHSYDF